MFNNVNDFYKYLIKEYETLNHNNLMIYLQIKT
jgi:hypothetical protein